MTEAVAYRHRRLTYSRFVAWAKVVLPLVALGILSTIFLVSHRIDPNAGIPFADVDVEELTREQRITNPSYAGVTDDGTLVTIDADRARPDLSDPGRATAERIRARLDSPGGLTTTVDAPEGRVDTGTKSLRLTGGVTLTTSDGYHMTAPTVLAALNEGELEATGPVLGRGPAGTLEAGAMQILRRSAGEDADPNYRLVFTEGVRIVYQPPKTVEERGHP